MNTDANEAKKIKAWENILPVIRDSFLEKKCHNIIRYNKGCFRSEREKKLIIESAKEGNDRDDLPKELIPKIIELIKDSDLAVIFNGWTVEGKNKKIWYYAFIVDETGIRISLKISWFWVKVKRPKAPFSKANYHDTAFRRCEQNAGDDKHELEWRFSGVIVRFNRGKKKRKK